MRLAKEMERKSLSSWRTRRSDPGEETLKAVRHTPESNSGIEWQMRDASKRATGKAPRRVSNCSFTTG